VRCIPKRSLSFKLLILPCKLHLLSALIGSAFALNIAGRERIFHFCGASQRMAPTSDGGAFLVISWYVATAGCRNLRRTSRTPESMNPSRRHTRLYHKMATSDRHMFIAAREPWVLPAANAEFFLARERPRRLRDAGREVARDVAGILPAKNSSIFSGTFDAAEVCPRQGVGMNAAKTSATKAENLAFGADKILLSAYDVVENPRRGWNSRGVTPSDCGKLLT